MNRLPLILVLALTLTASLAAAADRPAPERGGEAWNLTLFHTNDAHSYFLPRPAHWRGSDGKMVGGVIPLAWHLQDQRESAAPDILLDAGDFMTGNPVCNLEKDGVPGYAVAEWMNGLGYDAGVIGNHEFDVGSRSARRLARMFDFPMLAADIENQNGEPAFRREPLIIERNGLRIGVMGISCSGMREVVTASRFAPLTLVDPVSLVRSQISDLDPETDLLVLISHNGVEADRALAEELADDGLDVIVGGHSHTRLTSPEVVNGVLVVQAGSKMTSLGRLDLEVADDRVVWYDGRLITLWSDGTFADPELTELIIGLENQVLDTYGRELATLTVDLRKGQGEHNLGNWLADGFRTRAEADVALVNSGGIRKNLMKGPLTALDIYEVLPFSNSLVVAEMTGAQLIAVAQHNAEAQVTGKHGILQVSGLNYSFRERDGMVTMENLTVGGEPLDPMKAYQVAMPDFVAMMGDVYLGLEAPKVKDLGVTLSQVMAESAEKEGTITAAVEGRIRRLE
jgi:2',3'-cyclic-nucleotide 2'-phosphodiesterase (5'-nucleotidase family)